MLADLLPFATLAVSEIVPVGQEALYRVSLDFAGQNVTVEPQGVEFTEDYTMHWTFLGEPGREGWGAIYVHEFVLPQPLVNMRRGTVWGLETTCIDVTVEPYVVDGQAGWIGTGIDSEGGWRCWSVVVPLACDEENMTSVLLVNAKFENETLNEHLVKTMRSGKIYAGLAVVKDCTNNEFDPGCWWISKAPLEAELRSSPLETESEFYPGGTGDYDWLVCRPENNSADSIITMTSERCLVGPTKSDKYHYPTSRWAEKILPENQIRFSSSEEAMAAGYVPCGVCHSP